MVLATSENAVFFIVIDASFDGLPKSAIGSGRLISIFCHFRVVAKNTFLMRICPTSTGGHS